MKANKSEENYKRMKFCVQNEWGVVYNFASTTIPLYCMLNKKKMSPPYSLPHFVQIITDFSQ